MLLHVAACFNKQPAKSELKWTSSAIKMLQALHSSAAPSVSITDSNLPGMLI